MGVQLNRKMRRKVANSDKTYDNFFSIIRRKRKDSSQWMDRPEGKERPSRVTGRHYSEQPTTALHVHTTHVAQGTPQQAPEGSKLLTERPCVLLGASLLSTPIIPRTMYGANT